MVRMLVFIVLFAACEERGENEDDNSTENNQTTVEHKYNPAPGYDLEELGQKWQGTWVVGGWGAGMIQAWEVKDSKVLIYDGQKEVSYNLKIEAPCRAYVYSDDLSDRWIQLFVFDDRVLYSGVGSAGFVDDDKIVVCSKGWVFTYEEGKCKRWNKASPDRFIAEDGECSIEGSVFKAKVTSNLVDELELEDGILLSQDMKKNMATQTQNFTEAKKIIDAK